VTLRLRLLLVLVGIVAVGLLSADVATYASLRSYLFSQVDSQLQDDAIPIGTQVADAISRPFGRGAVTRVFPPPGLWIELRDQSGNDLGPVEAYPLAPPALPLSLPGSGSVSSSPVQFNANSGGTSNVAYRVLAEPIQVDGNEIGTVIVAIPLNDLHHTLGRLLLIEVLVSAAVLIVLGFLAWWIVRRNLRPLDQMASTAGAIAGGDLSRRVATTDQRTEVGQLGNALNTMLTGIEGAFAAQAASEERLRRFLADASHELRTPLTSIRGYSELFDRGARDRPEDLATSMRHIREEANRMSVLVDDLLLLARLDHQRPIALEHVDLSAIVSGAVDAARLRAPERVISLVAPGPVGVIGDADRLRQVVDNLLTNALLHTPEGSPVDVRLSTETFTACLEVSDRGPGIPVEAQADIFEPFHRADPTRARATGGVGLGLSIVSAIAHAHGGTVGVVSDPASDNGHGGATFWVRIPLASALPDIPTDEPAEVAER
jgi:two-component system OmpR family sensor kinase